MADDIYCAIYSKTAVAQNEQNKNHGCGFTGLRWSSDEESHKGWCNRVSQSLADRETEVRVEELLKCGIQFPAGADKWSNIYAHVAVAQNEANKAAGCNLSGSQWSSDYNYHYQWCLKADRNIAKAEMTERMNRLAQCTQK
ncbi:MAG: hypothetical protein AB4372_35580 [Xenococcus sp. (in: cyanobacteria)]